MGIKKPLVLDDLFNLDTEYESKHLVPLWDVLWNKAMKGATNKLYCYIVIAIAAEYHQRKLAFEQTFSEQDTNDIASLLPAKLKNEPQPPSIVWRLFILFWPDFLGATLVKILSDILQFANPQLLK